MHSDKAHKWDFNNLDSVLNDGLGKFKLNGINKPYLYIGGWGTAFAWHTEDLNLYSININHYGSPKFWYCLGLSEQRKLETYIKNKFPDKFLECSEYMRHKTTIVNPYELIQSFPNLQIVKYINKTCTTARRDRNHIQRCLPPGL